MDKGSGSTEDKREAEAIQRLYVGKDFSHTLFSGNFQTTALMSSQQPWWLA